MTTRNEAYRERYNAICDHRSIVGAADALGINYTTLAKWYHDHRDEFPPDVVADIKNNGGRQLIPSRPFLRPRAAGDRQEDVRQAKQIVDAIFERMQQLKDENERLRRENEILRAGGSVESSSNEHYRYRGTVDRLLDEIRA